MSNLQTSLEMDAWVIEYCEESNCSIFILYCLMQEYHDRHKFGQCSGFVSVQYEELFVNCKKYCSVQMFNNTVNHFCQLKIMAIIGNTAISDNESFDIYLRFDIEAYKGWIAKNKNDESVTISDVLDLFVDQGFPTNEMAPLDLNLIHRIISDGVSLDNLEKAINAVLLNPKKYEKNKFLSVMDEVKKYEKTLSI